MDRLLLLSPLVTPDVCRSLLGRADIEPSIRDRDDLENVLPLEQLLQASGGDCGSDTSWLMATSGTTSEPKLVSHSLEVPDPYRKL